jgi:hypothetical protein
VSLNDCLISVDGIDLRIPQQGFARKGNPFESHKYARKSALRYELGVDIITGHLVWINGLILAGAFPDIKKFCSCLSLWLDQDEHVEADDGYISNAPYKVKSSASLIYLNENQVMQVHVCSRQEMINMWLNQWEISKQVYCHAITKHGYVFRAIAVVVQIAIENGEPLFNVDYNDIILGTSYFYSCQLIGRSCDELLIHNYRIMQKLSKTIGVIFTIIIND